MLATASRTRISGETTHNLDTIEHGDDEDQGHAGIEHLRLHPRICKAVGSLAQTLRSVRLVEACMHCRTIEARVLALLQRVSVALQTGGAHLRRGARLCDHRQQVGRHRGQGDSSQPNSSAVVHSPTVSSVASRVSSRSLNPRAVRRISILGTFWEVPEESAC